MRQRYLALDVLRGLTIALMVLVNTPGSWNSIYAPFRHASWHGYTLTDLVFPTFLFVVGNAMSFSMKKFKERSDKAFFGKVLKRTILIFLIGLFLNAFPFFYRSEGELLLQDLSSVRIMGVLQRIALCYFFAALIIRYLRKISMIIISLIILFGYWAILYYFGEDLIPYSMKGNAVLKLDLLLFSPDNLYQGHGFPFDPEGVLSTLPAVVGVVAGYLVGVFIQKSSNTIKTVVKMAFAGVAFVLLGYFWDVFFPINKALWTSSYVILTVGWNLFLLSGLVLIIEVFSLKKWTYFFEVFGRNPLFIYAMSGIVITLIGMIWINGESLKSLLYSNFYTSWLDPNNASLLFAISYVLLMWLIGYWMDKRNIYIKV